LPRAERERTEVLV